ncbi:unnamed protein product [Vicia faba]|uniref:Uncharacterized protein n=1 Tax=Vicia faba TaxID=3906 RepID=A0AAV0ZNF4_VICFA|nr:unnamed protein product [Vicia faba]
MLYQSTFFPSLRLRQVWSLILRWLNINTALHSKALENFQQFEGLSRSGMKQAEKFHIVWFACIWVLWNGHNEKVFRDKQRRLEQMTEEIKITSWKWLKCKLKGFNNG